MSLRKLIISMIGIILPLSSQAVMLTVDEILYQGGASTNSSLLSGTIDMTMTATGLSIKLTNTTSGVVSADAASNLLTGLGFNLPNGVYIDFGSANVAAGSTTLGFNSSDVSGEWGYDNSPLNAGPFQTAPNGGAVSSVNTTIATLEASTTNKFSGTPVKNPGNLAGPDFGLLSSSVDSSTAGGLAAIQDSIIIDITLAGLEQYLLANPGFDLIAWIDSQDVVISFGSPDSTTLVPEATGLSLLSIGLLGFLVAGKRKRV